VPLFKTNRPDGNEVVCAALDGQLYFWDVESAALKGAIDGNRDIRGGRGVNDRFGSKSDLRSQHFTSVTYTADGECVLAGGRSRWVCLYHVSRRILLRKFEVSNNRSLDGVLDFQNSSLMTEAGPMGAIEDAADSDDEAELRLKDRAMPGATRSHTGERTTRPEVRTKSVKFSPTGLQWAAATTEGLLLFARDTETTFDPVELQLDITPANVLKCCEEEQFSKALTMSLCLNEEDLVGTVLDQVPLARCVNLCVNPAAAASFMWALPQACRKRLAN
jgi:periodic tryptophan protein 2